MADIQGNNVGAAVVPFTTDDTYETHRAKYGQGGLRTVDDEAARDAIPFKRREWWMQVRYLADGSTWELAPGLSSDELDDNDNWQPVKAGSVLPSARLHVVQGGGQSGGQLPGSFENSYPTLNAAHQAAVAGDVIVVLYGGGGTFQSRAAYDETFVLTKQVSIVGIGRPVFSGTFNWGAYGGGQSLTAFISGIEFAAGCDVLKQTTGAHNLAFEDCVWASTSALKLFGQGVSNAAIDLVTVRRGRFVSQPGALAPLRFAQRDDNGQAQTLVLEDSAVDVATGAATVSGTMHPDSRLVLRGSTRITVIGGGAQTYDVMRQPSNTAWASINWLQDQRPTGGGSGDLSNYYTKEEVDNLLEQVGAGEPVDLSNYYTKAQADARYAQQPARDPFDVPTQLRTDVLAGTFTNGELDGVQPAGSLPAMSFTTNTHKYVFERGAGGTLVWCMYKKG